MLEKSKRNTNGPTKMKATVTGHSSACAPANQALPPLYPKTRPGFLRKCLALLSPSPGVGVGGGGRLLGQLRFLG